VTEIVPGEVHNAGVLEGRVKGRFHVEHRFARMS